MRLKSEALLQAFDNGAITLVDQMILLYHMNRELAEVLTKDNIEMIQNNTRLMLEIERNI